MANNTVTCTQAPQQGLHLTESFLLSLHKAETVSTERLQLPERKAPSEARLLFYENKALEARHKDTSSMQTCSDPMPSVLKGASLPPCNSGDGASV